MLKAWRPHLPARLVSVNDATALRPQERAPRRRALDQSLRHAALERWQGVMRFRRFRHRLRTRGPTTRGPGLRRAGAVERSTRSRDVRHVAAAQPRAFLQALPLRHHDQRIDVDGSDLDGHSFTLRQSVGPFVVWYRRALVPDHYGRWCARRESDLATAAPCSAKTSPSHWAMSRFRK